VILLAAESSTLQHHRDVVSFVHFNISHTGTDVGFSSLKAGANGATVNQKILSRQITRMDATEEST